MMLTEDRILSQVTHLPALGCVNVQWINRVLRDGVVISETPQRASYTLALQEDRVRFLAEVEGATAYLNAFGQ
jgi:hypothetical protein